MKTLILLSLVAALAVACTPSTSAQPSPVVPPPDAGTPSPATVCQHLASVGCQEGIASSCTATLSQINLTRVTDPKVGCLMAAVTAAAVQACGTVACTAPSSPSASH